MKGTQPRDSGAPWQASARGPESAQRPELAKHKTLYPDTCWKRRPGWLAAQTRITQGKLAQAAQREIRVYNRAKRMREESRPAGPRGPQDTDCQRILSSGVVPLAHAWICNPSPGKPGGRVNCCATPSRCGDTPPNRRGGRTRNGTLGFLLLLWDCVPSRWSHWPAGRWVIGSGVWGSRVAPGPRYPDDPG